MLCDSLFWRCWDCSFFGQNRLFVAVQRQSASPGRSYACKVRLVTAELTGFDLSCFLLVAVSNNAPRGFKRDLSVGFAVNMNSYFEVLLWYRDIIWVTLHILYISALLSTVVLALTEPHHTPLWSCY